MPSKRKKRKSAAEKACEFLIRASNPLRNIGPNQFPIGIASGCVLDYGGHRWLLTVAHATGNLGRWAIELEFQDGIGAKLWGIGNMNFTGLLNFTKGTSEALDMAYAKVPDDLEPKWQERNKQEEIIRTVPRIILKSDLHTVPSRRRTYGFAGNIRPTTGPSLDMPWLMTELVCYPKLKFAGGDQQYYFFKLPFAHPGHDFFRGASGSPICDRKGNVVALVCGAGDEPDTIQGIKIEYFRSALDVAILELKREADDSCGGDQ